MGSTSPSLSSSERVAPLMAMAMSARGKSIFFRKTVFDLPHRLSFVCVCYSFATTPMSPAWSVPTSKRSLPIGTLR